jgi:ATP-binding cassette subfamily B protein
MAWAAAGPDGRDGASHAHSRSGDASQGSGTPAGAPAGNGPGSPEGVQAEAFTGEPVGISIDSVTLQAGGHVILDDIHLEIAPGEHVAIVGPSGAGKSSLVGLLLGWHRPSQGVIRVDGQALDGPGLLDLRRATAWVDPAVQLWNRSLYDNLRYGMQNHSAAPIGEVIQTADLYDVLERLPEGLKTDLGEGGGLVSGGEGQRVRLGRAMLREDVRLVILDEPFRGLDREKRRALLQAARRLWQAQTLLCITHDIGETQTFPRVLVIENGRIVEDAAPEALAADPNSRYRAILAAEQAVRRELWESAEWRRLRMEKGVLEE